MGTDNLKPFQPGESGNPNGRPKGRKNMSTILNRMLRTKIDVEQPDGTTEKHTFRDLIVKRLLTEAYIGNIRAIQEIFDRTEGKAKQEIEQKTTIKDERIDLSKLSEDELRILAEIQRKSGTSKA